MKPASVTVTNVVPSAVKQRGEPTDDCSVISAIFAKVVVFHTFTDLSTEDEAKSLPFGEKETYSTQS